MTTPVIDKISPGTLFKFIFSTLKMKEINIINTGVIKIINTLLRTRVKFNQ